MQPGAARHKDGALAAALVAVLTMASSEGVRAQDETSKGEWRSSGGDSAYTRYSPLDQITRDNVKDLRIVWRRPGIDPEFTERYPRLRTGNYLRATPTMIAPSRANASPLARPIPRLAPVTTVTLPSKRIDNLLPYSAVLCLLASIRR